MRCRGAEARRSGTGASDRFACDPGFMGRLLADRVIDNTALFPAVGSKMRRTHSPRVQ